MKKLVPLFVLFFLIHAPAGATVWTYSGVSHQYTDDGALYDITMNIQIEDQLWDIDAEQYVTPVPGTPLPQSKKYVYNVYDWSMNIGDAQYSGNAGNHSTGQVCSDGALRYFDDLVLWDENLLDASGELIILWTSTWTDADNQSWDYWQRYDSPGYGQLAPILVFSGVGGINSAQFAIELLRNPSPTTTYAGVPEPSMLLFAGAGLAGYLLSRKKRPIKK